MLIGTTAEKNNPRTPTAIRAPPSQEVLSDNLFVIQFIIDLLFD
jgi:hypothetical protein